MQFFGVCYFSVYTASYSINQAVCAVMFWIFGITTLFVIPAGYAQVKVALEASPCGAVSAGTTIRIKCSFASNSVAPSSMTWTHDGKDLAPGSLKRGKYVVSYKTTQPPETVLTVNDCDEGDGGMWMCTGRFPHSYIIGVLESVDTAEEDYELKVGVPRIQFIPGDVEVSLGETVNLKCNASGDPEPKVTWTKTSSSGAGRHPSGNMTVLDEELSLTVTEVSDGGRYLCVAENALGVANATVSVYVNHAPIFPAIQGTLVVKGRIGVIVTLSVTVSAYPFPSVTWFKEGVAITNDTFILVNIIDGIYSLQFVPEGSDFGRYSCIVENTYGRIEQTLLLIPAGSPITPLIVTPTRVTMTSILLSAGPPVEAGGVPVTQFRVVYREVGRIAITRKVFKSTDQILLTGLGKTRTYAVYLSAGNQAGWSGYSDVIFVSTLRVEPVTTPIPDHGPSSNTTDANNTAHMTTSLVHSVLPTTIPGRPSIGNGSTVMPAQTVDGLTYKAVVMVTKYPLNNTTGWLNDGRRSELTPIVDVPLSNSSSSQRNKTEGDLSPPVSPAPQKSAIFIICLVAVSIVCMMVVGFCLFMASTFPVHRWMKRRRKPKDNMEESFYESPNPINSEEPIQYRVRPLPSLISSFFVTPPANMEFPQENLILGNLIGQGSFGVVYQAEAHGIVQPNETTKVAVKLLKEDYTELHEVAFQKELQVMMRLKPHPFVIGLLGCCTTSEPQLIIMEYLPLENLLTHLRQSRQHVTNHMTQRVSLRTTISPSDLVRYGYEIANGMAYLASMKCIYRDLAARNILRSSDDVCKLSDFNLARDVIKDGIAHRKTQGRSSIRWMSTESLLENVFTIRSNVWSFGVLLWEIVTIGSYPYSGITSGKLTRFLQDGKRMPKPDHCSQALYSLMMQCWQTDPKKRPSFDDLSRKLEATLSESRNYLVLEGFKDGIYECAENIGRR